MSNALPTGGTSMTSAGVALVTGVDGDIEHADGGGLYHRDRCIVDALQFTIDGAGPRRLRKSRIGVASERITYAHWADRPDPQAVVVRERTIRHGYEEAVTVTAFRQPVEMKIRFDLRPGVRSVYDNCLVELSSARARLASTLWSDGLTIDDAGTEDDLLTMSATLRLQPGTSTSFRWGIRLHDDETPAPPAPTIFMPDSSSQMVVDRALWDLEALTIVDPATQRSFPAAGAPHFLAVFGRDALIISLLTLATGTNRALDTLEVLAAHQGTTTDPSTLEEPGRILHELRIGDMGVFGLDAGTPYYGSVDSTPLFVVLLGECLRWGADQDRLRALLPNARAAIDWCRHHVDENGFVQSRPHATGIGNQGWKDSGDAIVDEHGGVIHDATSLVEVQGYVHRALLDLAELEHHLGDPGSADQLRAEADDLRERFGQHFHDPVSAGFVLALDGRGRRITARASNPGHLLATDIIDAADAAHIADRLMSPADFSGWGVRTLSTDEAGFHPLGYHLGTVWPHDNALIMRGMGFQGLHEHAHRLATSMLDLAAACDFQLPELLGGFDRIDFPDPVPYPASARPQGWAAAVPIQIVSTLLGLRPDLHRGRLELRSILRPGQKLAIRGLQLGPRRIDIEADGERVAVGGDITGLDLIGASPLT